MGFLEAALGTAFPALLGEGTKVAATEGTKAALVEGTKAAATEGTKKAVEETVKQTALGTLLGGAGDFVGEAAGGLWNMATGAEGAEAVSNQLGGAGVGESVGTAVGDLASKIPTIETAGLGMTIEAAAKKAKDLREPKKKEKAASRRGGGPRTLLNRGGPRASLRRSSQTMLGVRRS